MVTHWCRVQNFIAFSPPTSAWHLLPEIIRQFELYKANQEKSVDVEVVSAFDLAEATAHKLASASGSETRTRGKGQHLHGQDLLGGVLIRAGDLVIDGSVRGRLNKLAEAMNS